MGKREKMKRGKKAKAESKVTTDEQAVAGDIDVDALTEEFMERVKQYTTVHETPALLSGSGVYIDYPSPMLNWISGPGAPFGQIVVLGGDEGSGKTTTALHICKAVQDMGGIANYHDAENKLTQSYRDALGVSRKRFAMAYPQTLEEGLDVISQAIDRARAWREKFGRPVPMVVVLDSLNMLLPESQNEGSWGEGSRYGPTAALLSDSLPKFTKPLANEHVLLVVLTQMRVNIDEHGNAKPKIAGGSPMWHSAKQIFFLERSNPIYAIDPELSALVEETKKKGKPEVEKESALTRRAKKRRKVTSEATKVSEVIGQWVFAKCWKNQTAQPFRFGKFPLIYPPHGQGIDKARDWAHLLIERKKAVANGSWFTLDIPDVDVLKAQGEEALAAEVAKRIGDEKFLAGMRKLIWRT